MVRRSSCGPITCWFLARASLYEMHSILWWHLISMACIFLWSSTLRVHDSQTYRKMNVTRELIRCILELREILLSFQIGFNHVHVCAILESISGLEPSSVIAEPRYLKLVTVSNFCPFTLISLIVSVVPRNCFETGQIHRY